MKKLISVYFHSILIFLFAGCTLDVLDPNQIYDSEIGGIRITVDVDATDLLTKYSVISASLGIIDSTGKAQYTNWTVASTNQQFTFQAISPGITYICLTDRDSLGDTNVFYTNATLTAGHNYNLLVRLGAGTKRFGIYSESVPLGVNWGSDVALDVWDGTTVITEEYNSAGDGISNYVYTGGGAGWLGVSYRVNPNTVYKDMHSYKEGSLRFMFRGTKPIRVGIQDGAGTQRWVYAANIFNFGLKTNDTWCSVVIPFTNFATNINFSQIANYFTVIGETSFTAGTIYRIDNIYWCNKTN